MDSSRSSQSNTMDEVVEHFNVYEHSSQDVAGPSNPAGPWQSRDDEGFLSESSLYYGATGCDILEDSADDESAVWDNILTDVTSDNLDDIFETDPSISSVIGNDSLGDSASFSGEQQRGPHLHHGASAIAGGVEQTIDGMQRLDLEEELSLLSAQDKSHEEAQDVGASSQLYIPNEEIFAKTPTKRKNRDRGPKSWEFLARLLFDPRTNPAVIKWEDEETATFRLKKPDIIARMWQYRKPVRKDVPYINFARALRHYYNKETLIPIPEKQLVYRFGPPALPYLESLRQSKG